MQPRRSLALTVAALALTAPALTSCGFDYATDRYYTPANGANNRDGAVDVLGAVIVSTQPGSGTFIASLSNNSTSEAASFSELAPTEGGGATVAEFEPVEIPAGGLVNLAEPPAEIEVTGDFEAGDWVELALGFDNGERAVVEVPVVDNHGYFEGLDGEPLPVEETESGSESSH